MNSSTIRNWLMIAMVLVSRVAVGQSTIELRSSARAVSGSRITLGQVATLSGPEASALADVTVVPAGPGQPRRVTTAQVRAAIDAHGTVNWGRISLRGATCHFTWPAPEAQLAQKPAAVQAVLSEAADSVRKAVADRISRLVQAEPANLRLSFDADDAEILNLSTTGRTLEVKPTAASDKLPLALTLYEGDRIVATRSIRVGVLVKRTVVIAAAAKSRGDTIAAADVTIDEQWVGPNLKAAAPDAVIGAATQGRIATGQIIGVGDVAAATIVAKGEQVSVSCVSGSIVLTTKARAMSAGRVGDVIQFQGLEDKRTFTARMSARGRAVVTAASSCVSGGGSNSESMP